jgi:hypothetical protein
VAHPLGEEFPREGFVQASVEANFADCEIEDGGTVDLVCMDTDSDTRWVIEAKGETSATGLDFRTGLGQLLIAMKGPANYALAMPDTPAFERLRNRISPEVRRALNIYWLIVEEDGEVTAVAP